MTVIKVPHPPKGSSNPDRPASALLLAQVVHLHEAEKNLPFGYRSERYIKAVRTEGEAANYIREVTEAIHSAHEEARRRRFAMGRNAATEIAAGDMAGLRREGSGARRRAKKSNQARGRRRG
jgi:hypothetical protein